MILPGWRELLQSVTGQYVHRAIGALPDVADAALLVGEQTLLADDTLAVEHEPHERLSGQRAEEDIVDPKSGETIVKRNRKFTKAVIKRIEDAGIKKLEVPTEMVLGRVASEDIFDEKTGEVLLEVNHELTEKKLEELRARGIKEIKVI